jgi:uncharacterized protein with HEPN domain
MRNNTADRQRLFHILEAIKQIEIFTQNFNPNVFDNNLVRSACIFQLEIIGEAVNKISKKIKDKYQDIDWINITGLRNIIAHEYWGIDYSIVWSIISFELPKLKANIENIIVKEKLE